MPGDGRRRKSPERAQDQRMFSSRFILILNRDDLANHQKPDDFQRRHGRQHRHAETGMQERGHHAGIQHKHRTPDQHRIARPPRPASRPLAVKVRTRPCIRCACPDLSRDLLERLREIARPSAARSRSMHHQGQILTGHAGAEILQGISHLDAHPRLVKKDVNSCENGFCPSLATASNACMMLNPAFSALLMLVSASTNCALKRSSRRFLSIRRIWRGMVHPP